MSYNYLSRDNIYNILMQSDYHTTMTICNTHKMANGLCQEQYFWIDKIKNIDPNFELHVGQSLTVLTINELQHIYHYIEKGPQSMKFYKWAKDKRDIIRDIMLNYDRFINKKNKEYILRLIEENNQLRLEYEKLNREKLERQKLSDIYNQLNNPDISDKEKSELYEQFLILTKDYVLVDNEDISDVSEDISDSSNSSNSSDSSDSSE